MQSLPTKRALALLTLDSLAGLSAGCITFLAAPLLLDWYGWSDDFIRFVATANVCYGSYSGVLALRLRRKAQLSRWTVILLIVANSLWAVQCFVQVVLLRDSATALGLGVLAFEGVFVGGLAYLEARFTLPAAGNLST